MCREKFMCGERERSGTFNKNRLPLIEWIAQWLRFDARSCDSTFYFYIVVDACDTNRKWLMIVGLKIRSARFILNSTQFHSHLFLLFFFCGWNADRYVVWKRNRKSSAWTERAQETEIHISWAPNSEHNN